MKTVFIITALLLSMSEPRAQSIVMTSYGDEVSSEVEVLEKSLDSYLDELLLTDDFRYRKFLNKSKNLKIYIH